jgi:hypothetical protein
VITTLSATVVIDEKRNVTTLFLKKIFTNDLNEHLTTLTEKDISLKPGEHGSVKFHFATAAIKNFKTDNDGMSPSQVVANKRADHYSDNGNTGKYNKRSSDKNYSDEFLKWYYDDDDDEED